MRDVRLNLMNLPRSGVLTRVELMGGPGDGQIVDVPIDWNVIEVFHDDTGALAGRYWRCQRSGFHFHWDAAPVDPQD